MLWPDQKRFSTHVTGNCRDPWQCGDVMNETPLSGRARPAPALRFEIGYAEAGWEENEGESLVSVG